MLEMLFDILLKLAVFAIAIISFCKMWAIMNEPIEIDDLIDFLNYLKKG